ncbi:bL28 family ribosomal protein [Patescibacteria group bacterium]
MSRICEICGKSYQKAKLVPRGIGNRVTRRTNTRKGVNIRNKRINLNGKMVRVKLCASCLKKIKKNRKDSATAQKPQEPQTK